MSELAAGAKSNRGSGSAPCQGAASVLGGAEEPYENLMVPPKDKKTRERRGGDIRRTTKHVLCLHARRWHSAVRKYVAAERAGSQKKESRSGDEGYTRYGTDRR